MTFIDTEYDWRIAYNGYLRRQLQKVKSEYLRACKELGRFDAIQTGGTGTPLYAPMEMYLQMCKEIREIPGHADNVWLEGLRDIERKYLDCLISWNPETETIEKLTPIQHHYIDTFGNKKVCETIIWKAIK
jgi:hypothetical protein